MIDWAPLFTAFSLGLLSSAHCVGMCGGIMGALTMAIPADARQRRFQLLLTYNLGRIGSYTLMGVLLGAFAGALSGWAGETWLRMVAGVLLIAMGLYLADWWRGLIYLERVGRYLWAYLQPLGKPLMPVNSLPKAALLGVIWGWLPCGLVYTALAYAAAQANIGQAGGVMLAFGLGTLPAVLATGFVARKLAGLLQARGVRIGFAVLIIFFGIWTMMGGGPGHDHHQPEAENTPPHQHSAPAGEQLHHHH
ncbi:sulfite exporter TauE/SafE family protein [Cellvibrio sp. ARAG 10.3]|uniref:sulfite exporter TauE/SafE family protein n=1 Tax=Cellvibrio sp. ARAG 10.3 TaxID=3451358 RepID=UPI003F45674D